MVGGCRTVRRRVLSPAVRRGSGHAAIVLHDRGGVDRCDRRSPRHYRTNIHHTLKKKPLRFEDLADFIDCYNPKNRHKRKATWNAEKNPEGRWRKFSYEELTA